MQIPKLFSSSIDPQKIGLTVKGFLMLLVPLILAVTGLTNVNVGESDLNLIIDAIVNVVVIASTLASAVMVLVGAFRKIAVAAGWMEAKK